MTSGVRLADAAARTGGFGDRLRRLLIGDEHRLGGEHLARQDAIGLDGLGGLGLGSECGQRIGIGRPGQVGEAGVLGTGQGLGEALGGAARATAAAAMGLLVLVLDGGIRHATLDAGSLTGSGWVGHGATDGWPIGRRRSIRASSRSTRDRSDATSPRDSPRASSAWP